MRIMTDGKFNAKCLSHFQVNLSKKKGLIRF